MSSFSFSDYDYDEAADPNVNKPKITPLVKSSFEDTSSRFSFDDYDTSSPEIEEEEGLLKTAARYALQVPKGYFQATPVNIAANTLSMIAQGESLAELDELEERLPELRKKFPQFDLPEKIDREKYLQAVQDAANSFPTVSNISRGIESATGVPLEAKTRGQKAVEFAMSAGKLAPAGSTFRGLSTSLPKPVLGAGISATKEALVETGLPEPIAEIASFLALKTPPKGSGGEVTKPSGLKERKFESVEKPREVSSKKMMKINKAVEDDFKSISDKIIKESPVGEVAKNLREDATFKQQSRELLGEAQKIADTIPEKINSSVIKDEINTQSKKVLKGFAPSEYDKNYSKLVKDRLKDIPKGEVSASNLVEQYRKNNSALSEYFEPGSSKAFNRAKRDVILDENRAIAAAMEKQYPKSDLSKVFKEGNDRWTKIMDAETIDGYITSVFDKKIDFKGAQAIFDDPNTSRVFKRALGEEGYTKFTQLTKDLLTSEKAYKNLSIAKEKGYIELAKNAMLYMIHPNLGAVSHAKSGFAEVYKSILNRALEKPKLINVWDKANNALKAGDFKAADALYKTLEKEVTSSMSKEEAVKYYLIKKAEKQKKE